MLGVITTRSSRKHPTLVSSTVPLVHTDGSYCGGSRTFVNNFFFHFYVIMKCPPPAYARAPCFTSPCKAEKNC